MIPPHPLPLVPLLGSMSKYTLTKGINFCADKFSRTANLELFSQAYTSFPYCDRSFPYCDRWTTSKCIGRLLVRIQPGEQTLVAHWKRTLYFQKID